jgi:hypothetical protein
VPFLALDPMTFCPVGLFSVLAITALAQEAGGGPQTHSSPADLVLPRSGSPITLEQIEERSHKLESGSIAIETIKSKIYRDSTGRLRIEWESRYAEDPPSTQTVLIDPAAGSRVILFSDEKIAYRITGPKAGESGFALGLAGVGEGLPASHQWTTTKETLGKRTIEGDQFEGARITQTSEGEAPLTNATERWYSEELKLTGFAAAVGPYGKHTASVRNIHRGQPDPMLFVVPADFNIVDVQL